MNLLTKFSLIFSITYGLGLCAVGLFFHKLLQHNARVEVREQANMMMNTALSVRKYTAVNVQPIIEKLVGEQDVFHPERVPAFSATEVLKNLRDANPEYSAFFYKEATLNPTNPRDQARGWEEDVVNGFRNQPDLKEVFGERHDPPNDSLYLAHPLVIPAGRNCLACHSTRDAAPPAMIKEYSLAGTVNGFGWKEGETVGAQIVSVPLSKPIEMANTTFREFMVSFVAVGIATLAILNALLYYTVVRPIRRLAENADTISKGQVNVPELQIKGRDEVSVMAGAFNRMHRSLAAAIKMIEDS
jgi:HAMP domain-containing protein